MEVKLQVPSKNVISFCLQVFSNGDEELEKAMEEILRDSEKDQYVPALQEGFSDACGQAAADGSAGQTQTSLQLVLDPSTTGIA